MDAYRASLTYTCRMDVTKNALMNTYARYPLTLVHGVGSRVWDDAGKDYLDFISGIAVNTLGHAHPKLAAAIAGQAGTMLHCSNLFHIPKQQQLAAKLAGLSGLERVFFSNSGAEANEGAIKLARKFFFDQGSARRGIISATQSFHGRLLSTLTATGQEKVKQGFDPLPPGFRHVPLNDIAALEAAMGDDTAAVLLEPLQGEGGVNPATTEYLKAVRKLCDDKGALLILDEIQTGMGRTGTMFAFEHAGIQPDILTLAKGLGGGVPIGALLATEKVAESFGPGTHGSTFGGNPLSCTAALTVIAVMEEDGLLLNVAERGAQLHAGLEVLCAKCSWIHDVRGQGLLLGLGCAIEVAPVIAGCRDAGMLVLPAGPRVLRMLPPLNVSATEISEALGILETVFTGVES